MYWNDKKKNIFIYNSIISLKTYIDLSDKNSYVNIDWDIKKSKYRLKRLLKKWRRKPKSVFNRYIKKIKK